MYPDVEVEEILIGAVGTMPVPPISPRDRKRRRPGWAVAVVAAAVVLLTVGGVGILIIQWSRNSPPVVEESSPTTVIEGVRGGWSTVPLEEGTLAVQRSGR